MEWVFSVERSGQLFRDAGQVSGLVAASRGLSLRAALWIKRMRIFNPRYLKPVVGHQIETREFSQGRLTIVMVMVSVKRPAVITHGYSLLNALMNTLRGLFTTMQFSDANV